MIEKEYKNKTKKKENKWYKNELEKGYKKHGRKGVQK